MNQWSILFQYCLRNYSCSGKERFQTYSIVSKASRKLVITRTTLIICRSKLQNSSLLLLQIASDVFAGESPALVGAVLYHKEAKIFAAGAPVILHFSSHFISAGNSFHPSMAC
jgi:hypothetical protein